MIGLDLNSVKTYFCVHHLAKFNNEIFFLLCLYISVKAEIFMRNKFVGTFARRINLELTYYENIQ